MHVICPVKPFDLSSRCRTSNPSITKISRPGDLEGTKRKSARARGGERKNGEFDAITRITGEATWLHMWDITRTCNFTITANLLTLENSRANCWVSECGAMRWSCGGHYVKQFKLFSKRRIFPNDHRRRRRRHHRYFLFVSTALCFSISDRGRSFFSLDDEDDDARSFS